MKIAVEADALTNGNRTGVYHYINNLLAALIDHDGRNQWSFVYFSTATDPPPELRHFGPAVETRPIRRFPVLLYRVLLRTPFAPPIDLLARAKPDLMLFPNFVRWPLARTKRSIVVVYDTAYRDHPETLKTKHQQLYLSRAVPRSIKKASAVVAISESTKRDVIRHHGTPAAKIRVVTPAVDHAQFRPAPPDEIERMRSRYAIGGRYVLFFGTIEPRKNLLGLLRAYAALPAPLRSEFQLVLAGGAGWRNEEIDRLISELGDQVVKTGYVDDADAAALYSGAAVFVFPSLYEGWGMPPLEAMACGTPVVVSDNSSLPEVVGDAAVMVDAHDATALSNAIERVLTDEPLAQQLRDAGLARAATFTWEASARELQSLIDEVTRT